MKNKYVDLEVLNQGFKNLATKINTIFRKVEDSYDKTEIDNKFKDMNWKSSVATKEELDNLTDNKKNDTRIVEAESIIYIYNGTSWDSVGSSTDIPKATKDNDGLMSKEDFTKLEGIEPDKYVQKEENKSLVLDTEIAKIHEHTNIDSLNKLSEDEEGNPLYDGKEIGVGLTPATEDTLGGIKVGSNLEITDEGVLSATKVSEIDNTKLADDLTYSSNKINDTYVAKEEGKSLVDDTEISKIHEHGNKAYLDKISEDENGKPTYNGKEINTNTISIDDINVSKDTTYSSDKIETIKTELKKYTDDLISGMTSINIEEIKEEPTLDNTTPNKIYLYEVDSDKHIYQQYLRTDTLLVELGTTELDLINYYSKTETDGKFALIAHTHEISAINELQNVLDGKAESIHKHKVEDITDFPTSLKNPNAITIQLNSGDTEDTDKFTYNGEDIKTINITADSIGASAKTHNHDTVYRKIEDSYSKDEIDTKNTTKQDKLKVGTNITISDDNTISATEIDDTKSSTISVYSSDKSDKTYESIANYNTDKGTTDISTIGDGTFTGAIGTLNTLINNVATDEDIASLFS